MIPSPFAEEMNNIRLVVLVESEPQSDHYHQIELTSEQFRKLSDVLAGMFQVEDGVMLPLVENVCINVADLENFVVE